MSILFNKQGKSAPKKRVVRKNSVPAAKSNVKNVKATSGNSKSANRMMAGNPNMKAMKQPSQNKKPVSPSQLVQQGVARHMAAPNTKGVKY